MHVFRRLAIGKRSFDRAHEIHLHSRSFPKHERFGLTAQVRRAALSVPSNIAEGSAHGDRSFARHLTIALGSLYEVETQIELACELGYLDSAPANDLISEIDEIRRMTLVFRRSLKRR